MNDFEGNDVMIETANFAGYVTPLMVLIRNPGTANIGTDAVHGTPNPPTCSMAAKMTASAWDMDITISENVIVAMAIDPVELPAAASIVENANVPATADDI